METEKPIVKDNKLFCPLCEEELLQGPGVVLTRPPWYQYFCPNKCGYSFESQTLYNNATYIYNSIY